MNLGTGGSKLGELFGQLGVTPLKIKLTGGRRCGSVVGHLLSLCKALSSTPGNAGRKEGGWGGREEVYGLWLPLLLACCDKPEPSSLE